MWKNQTVVEKKRKRFISRLISSRYNFFKQDINTSIPCNLSSHELKWHGWHGFLQKMWSSLNNTERIQPLCLLVTCLKLNYGVEKMQNRYEDNIKRIECRTLASKRFDPTPALHVRPVSSKTVVLSSLAIFTKTIPTKAV